MSYLDKINPEAARKDDKYTFFRDDEESEDITNHKMGIAAVEQELDAHRRGGGQAFKEYPPSHT